MAQLKDIKERINSVKKTRKMTQAMKMVSAAKFKRYSKLAITSRFVVSELDSLICNISDDSENDFLDIVKSYKSNNEILVILAGDRGLCGGFNSSVLKKAQDYLDNSDNNVELILFGRKAVQYFKNTSYKVIKYFENYNDTVTIDDVDYLLNDYTDMYLTKNYSKVTLLYNEFKTAVTSNLLFKQLFPVKLDKKNSSENKVESDVIVEPDYHSVFTSLVNRYIKFTIYNSFLESVAAEQGARMAAMDSATDNAGDMIKELTLIYNRQRQAQITTELSEIVAGAEALVN
mgnify:FL=1|jgi:F-type H+-transporting ATPase subunit gamma